MKERWVEHGLARMLPWAVRLRQLGWRFYRPITIGVRALVIGNDELLLVRGHGQRIWHLPGGGVKRGEMLAQTAQREVREETGWQVEVERLIGMYSHFGEGKSDHVAIFVCKPVQQGRFRLNIEIAEARFFTLGALPPCHRTVYRRLADYRTGDTVYGEW